MKLAYTINNKIMGTINNCTNIDIIYNIDKAKKLAILQCQKLLLQINKKTNAIKKMNLLTFCKFLHSFCRNNFIYSADKVNQIIKLPNYMLYKCVGDCKSYSLFIYGMLKAKGYNPLFKFVSYTNDVIPSHVYIVCNGIIIDGIIDKFNFEHKYNNAKYLK